MLVMKRRHYILYRSRVILISLEPLLQSSPILLSNLSSQLSDLLDLRLFLPIDPINLTLSIFCPITDIPKLYLKYSLFTLSSRVTQLLNIAIIEYTKIGN